MRYGIDDKKFLMKRTTEIEIELNETIAYRPRRETRDIFCPKCAAIVQMATPPMAAITMSLTEREVFRLVEADEVHFVELENLFICMESLGGK